MKSSEGRKKWFLEEMYWDLRGQFGAGKDLGSTFVPPNYNKDIDLVDPLQQMAYHSLRYDHLGGPPHHYINQLKRRQHRQSSSTGSGANIQERFSDKDEEQWVVLLEQNMHPNRTLVNPNNTWDISQSASSIMRRVFHFNNFLHLITVLMHIGLIIPLSTSLLGIGEKLDKITTTNNKISSKRNSNTLSLLKFLFQFLVGRNK